MNSVKRFLFLVAPMVLVMGCSTHKMCEEELNENKLQLAKTTQLANNMAASLQTQRAELNSLKRHNVANVRRERDIALDQLDQREQELETERQELERERFQLNQMRQLGRADLE